MTLALIAGIMPGLSAGLMSIDDLGMEMTLIYGTEQDKKLGKKMLPVIQNHHLLLATLLLASAAGMEAVPLVLDNQFLEQAVLLIPITLVLIFGEILPFRFLLRS